MTEATAESSAARTPTIGRMLHYYPDRDHPLFDRAPLPATVAMVHGCGNRVNLCVVDPNGDTFGVLGVPLVASGCGGDGESVEVDTEKHHCEWPPFFADAADAQRHSGLLLSIEDVHPELLERLEHELGKQVSSKMTEQINQLKTDSEEVASLRFDSIRRELLKEFVPRNELQEVLASIDSAECSDGDAECGIQVEPKETEATEDSDMEHPPEPLPEPSFEDVLQEPQNSGD